MLEQEGSMLRVRDIMTPHVFTLRADTTIEMAMWSFADQAVSGAPVRDERGRLIGVLSQRDLVDPVYRRASGARTVRELMTPVMWAIRPDAPAIEAVRTMVEKGIHRLPVLSEVGQLEGIVTRSDVLKALLAHAGLDDSAALEA
jgi:CBS-domain-containing membrane protein